MFVEMFLARSGATMAAQPDAGRSRQVLSEMAACAVRSGDAEKLLRTVVYALGHDQYQIGIRLGEGASENRPAVVLARRLENIGVLTDVKISATRGNPHLRARVNKQCSTEVRESVERLCGSGRWLEDGTAEIVRELATSMGVCVEVVSQAHLTLADGHRREVDVLVCGPEMVTLIECKAGPNGHQSVGRFAELAASIGVDAGHTIVVAPRVDDRRRYEDAAAFNPFTIADRDNLVDVLTAAVASPNIAAAATTPQAQPCDRVESSSDATPLVERETVAPEVIENALVEAVTHAGEPVRPNTVAIQVRDQLNCSRKAVNNVMRELLSRHTFVDTTGQPVTTFTTPIAGIPASEINTTNPEPNVNRTAGNGIADTPHTPPVAKIGLFRRMFTTR